jgi:hypothetical protein
VSKGPLGRSTLAPLTPLVHVERMKYCDDELSETPCQLEKARMLEVPQVSTMPRPGPGLPLKVLPLREYLNFVYVRSACFQSKAKIQ